MSKPITARYIRKWDIASHIRKIFVEYGEVIKLYPKYFDNSFHNFCSSNIGIGCIDPESFFGTYSSMNTRYTHDLTIRKSSMSYSISKWSIGEVFCIFIFTCFSYRSCTMYYGCSTTSSIIVAWWEVSIWTGIYTDSSSTTRSLFSTIRPTITCSITFFIAILDAITTICGGCTFFRYKYIINNITCYVISWNCYSWIPHWIWDYTLSWICMETTNRETFVCLVCIYSPW